MKNGDHRTTVRKGTTWLVRLHPTDEPIPDGWTEDERLHYTHHGRWSKLIHTRPPVRPKRAKGNPPR